MKKPILRARKVIFADETMPLRPGELAQYFHVSRSTIYVDIRRGYRFEYGRTTTPRHYRDWLREKASESPQKTEEQLRLDSELRRLG